MPSNTCLDGFDFRADGLFFDASGSLCVLMGTVEFNDFWNAFDACFPSPLGRKLIYAATDTEEAHLRFRPEAKVGKWFGRRRAEAYMAGRAACMGWGVFQNERVTSPAHDALTVGFLLAHREHLAGERFNLEWNQPTNDQIVVSLSPNKRPMTQPPPFHAPPWLVSDNQGSRPSNRRALDLDHRGAALYAGEARSFFLPVAVLQRLVAELRGRPVEVDGTTTHWKLDESIEDGDLFMAVAHASYLAYNNTDRPVYLQSGDDWEGHLGLHLSDRGFGHVEVKRSILDGDDCTEFLIHSPLSGVVAGAVFGMWCRAHGLRGDVVCRMVDGCLLLTVREPRVNYEEK